LQFLHQTFLAMDLAGLMLGAEPAAWSKEGLVGI
jgi:hypothetical protein